MHREQTFQTISWFWDLYKRDLLDLDPPYQRRSVWNQSFKDYFIDTILLSYPSPAIFLYKETSPEGVTQHNVVDGKQRLTTIFEFVSNEFPVYDDAAREELRGKYFRELEDDDKRALWGYRFSVEFLPTNEEGIINNIFDRINRNVAKLTPQELRHARFDGDFITTAESLTEWTQMMFSDYTNFPRIASKSRKQMKDVELTASLLLLLEDGPEGYSVNELDREFSKRDESWDNKHKIETEFREVIKYIQHSIEDPMMGTQIAGSRIENQADFYSLFGAVAELRREGNLPTREDFNTRLLSFIKAVEDERQRMKLKIAKRYYEYARSASNDKGPRRKRIEIIKQVVTGEADIN